MIGDNYVHSIEKYMHSKIHGRSPEEVEHHWTKGYFDRHIGCHHYDGWCMQGFSIVDLIIELCAWIGDTYVIKAGDARLALVDYSSANNIAIPKRLQCIYECQGCDTIVRSKANIDRICTSHPQKLAIKTVGGLIDFGMLSTIPPAILHQNKILLMMRDLRGMVKSVVKAGWGRPVFSKCCSHHLFQYLSFKELAAKIPEDNAGVAFLEHWIMKRIVSLWPSCF
jgi:hypothetical protein